MMRTLATFALGVLFAVTVGAQADVEALVLQRAAMEFERRAVANPLTWRELLAAAPDTETRARVLIAVGRVASPELTPLLVEIISDCDPEVVDPGERRALAFAVGRQQDVALLKRFAEKFRGADVSFAVALTERLPEDAESRSALFRAARQRPPEDEHPDPVVALLLHGAAFRGVLLDEDADYWLATNWPPRRRAAARYYALGPRANLERLRDSLKEAIRTEDPVLSALAARALLRGEGSVEGDLAFVRTAFALRSVSSVELACRRLEALDSASVPEASRDLASALAASTPSLVRLRAWRALERRERGHIVVWPARSDPDRVDWVADLGPDAVTRAVFAETEPSWLRAAALLALGRHDPRPFFGRDEVWPGDFTLPRAFLCEDEQLARLRAAPWGVRAAMARVSVAATLCDHPDEKHPRTEFFRRYAGDPDMRVRLAYLDELVAVAPTASARDAVAAPLADALFRLRVELGLAEERRIEPLFGGDPYLLARGAEMVARLEYDGLASVLLDVAGALAQRLPVHETEALHVLVDLMERGGEAIGVGDLEQLYVTTDDPSLRSRLRGLLNARGETVPETAPEVYERVPPLVSLPNRAELRTTKGLVFITLRPDVAPRTVTRFVTLARGGFYDGVRFLVDPGREVRTGCPRGDGYGHAERPLRDEPTPAVHREGTAFFVRRTGVHSASSQFALSLRPRPDLEGRVAAFGRVSEDGLSVLAQLTPEDVILGVRVWHAE